MTAIQESADRIDGVIVNGVPWFDDRGEPVNAHGGGILEHDGRYYLFGEYKTDDKNTFIGFSCYSSADLSTWRFENLVLPPQPDGLLGPERIGERVKVLRCPSTGQFVMLMHTDNLTYTDAHIGVAVSDTIAGDYRFLGAIRHEGEPLVGWDMGVFQDADDTGYLVLHEGDIYRLTADYTAIDTQVASHIAPGGESPAMFRSDDHYFVLFSNKTSWERNDNYYLSAPTIAGPWTHHGHLAPAGTLTHNSQCTFVLELRIGDRTVPMYMGDRWSFPHQASAATYVWLPITVDSDRLRIPEYWTAWDPTTACPIDLGGPAATRELAFRSSLPGSHVAFPVSSRRFALHGETTPHGGYARIDLHGSDGASLLSHLVDFYSKVPASGPVYVSPPLPDGVKTVTVTVTGDFGVWFNKAGDRFGSDDTRLVVTSVTDLD